MAELVDAMTLDRYDLVRGNPMGNLNEEVSSAATR
jgi:hypothetical protein